jgi:hypothetical protein
MAREEDAGWSNPKVLLIFAFIFLCGTSFGAVVMREYVHRHLHPAVLVETPPVKSSAANMDAASKLGLLQLEKELNLSGSQKETVMAVLDEYGKFYQNIEDQRQDVARHGERRILDCLDDTQKQKFEKMLGIKLRPQ